MVALVVDVQIALGSEESMSLRTVMSAVAVLPCTSAVIGAAVVEVARGAERSVVSRQARS